MDCVGELLRMFYSEGAGNFYHNTGKAGSGVRRNIQSDGIDNPTRPVGYLSFLAVYVLSFNHLIALCALSDNYRHWHYCRVAFSSSPHCRAFVLLFGLFSKCNTSNYLRNI